MARGALKSDDARGARAEVGDDLESLRGEVERLRRMLHVKDEFIAELVHELRSPLGAILGWAQVLAETDGEGLRHGLAVIERNAHLQARLIDDLMDATRLTRGKVTLERSAVGLDQLLRCSLDAVEMAARAKRIRFRVPDEPVAPPILDVDPERLQQALCNVLSNAIKFSPEQGTVRIALRSNETEVEIVVEDEGPGFDAAFDADLFEPYGQGGAGRAGGLGLGLSIVKGIVHLHEGRVCVENRAPGPGARVVLALPRARARRGANESSQFDPLPDFAE